MQHVVLNAGEGEDEEDYQAIEQYQREDLQGFCLYHQWLDGSRKFSMLGCGYRGELGGTGGCGNVGFPPSFK
jgi:hypothetical protein